MEPVLMGVEDIAGLPDAQLHKLINEIGNTPVVMVHFVIEGKIRTVYLKLEGANPTGSAKDRTGFSLIQELESQGALRKGSTVVESTSGNLGVALSLICRAKGYRFVAVVDPKTTQENMSRMQALGARIDLVDQPDASGGYLLSRLARVRELCQSSTRYAWTNQYSSAANPRIHYATTGPEIYRQMHGKVDAVFAAVSTGGTLAGIGRFFREVSPSTRIIGVDARGSVIFGTPAAPRKLTGIGSSRRSDFISQNLYDSYTLASDEEAFAFCRALSATTGIKVGGSSGAVLSACTKYLQAHPEATNVVCVCADRGENYTSSIFNDQWLQQHGLYLRQNHLGSVQDILPTLSGNQ